MCREPAGWSCFHGPDMCGLCMRKKVLTNGIIVMESKECRETIKNRNCSENLPFGSTSLPGDNNSRYGLLSDCTLCPRSCHVDRAQGQKGYCGQTSEIMAARAALHFWEEPCISGSKGSGAVFFSGCSLRCIYCQNYNIAVGQHGKPISLSRLSRIYLELQEQGAHNINLVTPTHFVPQIAHSLEQARNQGLSIPVIYNCGGYEKVSSLRLLEGLVDIYLPDLKYYDRALAARFSNAPDYFDAACPALAEMYRQTGNPVWEEDTGLLKRGIIVRHLVLPEQTHNSKKLLRYLWETYHCNILVSIMSQYTPLPQTEHIPELNHPVAPEDYRRVLHFAEQLGIQGYLQEGGTAKESFIPSFDYEGL